MQAQADLARIPVDVYPSLHATATGRRSLRPVGPRPGPDVTEAVGTWTPQHTYEPEWTADHAADFLAGGRARRNRFWHRGRRR